MLWAFLHSSKVLRAHLVLFAVLVGISPLLRVDSSSTVTDKLGETGVTVDMEAVLCGGLALVLVVEEELPCRTERPGQPVHSHTPRQEGE